MLKQYITIEFVSQQDVEDSADWTTTPEAMLRAKCERLAEFLDCSVDDAERLLLDRVTDIRIYEDFK